MKALKNTLLGLTMVMTLAAVTSAQNNPCNPCGGKAMKAGHAMNNGHGTTFVIDDPMKRNSVTFKSTAPLEDIVGLSNEINGQLVFDPTMPEAGGHGMLSIPISSLNTGIPLRDEHLASAAWLNAEKNPNVTFEISKVTNVKSVKGSAAAQTYDVVAVGDFSLNGVTKTISVPARITYLKESDMTKMKAPGDLLAVRVNFDITLADYGITGPEGMNLVGSKIGETVAIELSVIASSAASATMAGNPCGGKATMAHNPCGGKATMAHNPCGGKANMTANPCGAKASDVKHAGEPMNPCGGKR